MEPVFWLMRFGYTKTQRQKTGLCALKGQLQLFLASLIICTCSYCHDNEHFILLCMHTCMHIFTVNNYIYRPFRST